MTGYRYYKPRPRVGRPEKLILRVSETGEMATRNDAHGADVDWESAPNAQLADWDEITQPDALNLIYTWQMTEWNRLSDTYKSMVAQPQRLTE